MKITKLKIFKLHNLVDKDIDFYKDLNLLYGANGSGKTTILNILAYILKGEIFKLEIYNFEKIILFYENEKNENFEMIVQNYEEYFNVYFEGKYHKINKFNKEILFERDSIDEDLKEHYFRKNVICREIYNKFNCLYLPLDRVNTNYDEYSHHRLSYLQMRNGRNNLFRYMKYDKGLDKVQEIIYNQYIKISRTIESLTNKFKNNILKSLVTLKQKTTQEVIKELMNSKYYKKKEKYTQILIENKIIEKTEKENYEMIYDDIFDYIENIYISGEKDISFEWMYRVFEISKINEIIKLDDDFQSHKSRVYKPINRFLDAVNSFLTSSCYEKKMEISTNGKLILKDTKSNGVIDIVYLSSGEKQIITFFAYLIFGLEEKKPAIVIVDEPELSLHLSWQKIFLKQAMSVNEDVQYIFATHAPEIIGNYRDYTINIRR